MDKRYQVFLSSTFADLEEERREVMAALQKAGYFVAGMELFPSDDDESWEVIKRVIDQSDYYVLVIAGRYGTIGEGGKSFTEMEYDYAKGKSIPILAFLHSNPSNLPSKHVEKAHPEELELFKSKIDRLHNRRSWSSKHELATEVLASISQTVNLRPRTGWVRGNIADENEYLHRQLEDLRVEYQKIREERDSLIERLAALDDDKSKQMIAWDDDEVEMSIQVKEKGVAGGKMNEMTFTTQWSRLFDLIAPKLMGWSSIYEATRGVVSMLTAEVSRQSTALSELEFYGLTADSLSTIRNQFLALELILIDTKQSSGEAHGRTIFRVQTELWRLSERGIREHSLKHARRRET